MELLFPLNTQIYNSSNYGILAQTAKINGENVVINTAGLAGLACSYEIINSLILHSIITGTVRLK
jgi:hypothetical protein